jgi:hypothetical protein|tara:strand:+ start:4820 stop:5287 length:468 start_codon:yes stop_codon:yes gene_type:complete
MNLIEQQTNLAVFSKGLLAELETSDAELVSVDEIQKVLYIIKDNVPHTALKDMPLTSALLKSVNKLFNFNNVAYRLMTPNSNYTVHEDAHRGWGSYNYHAVVTTNPNCYFVYPKNKSQQLYSLEEDKIYMCCTNKPHTFMNAGSTDRIHLVFTDE